MKTPRRSARLLLSKLRDDGDSARVGRRAAFVIGVALSGLLSIPQATPSEGLSTTRVPPPPGPKEPGYVGSSTCVPCHGDPGRRWSQSHHAAAWSPPSERSVLGSFDGQRAHLDGTTVQLGERSSSAPRSGGDSATGRAESSSNRLFLVRLNPDGPSPTAYPIVGVVGISPLQQYLVETEPGRKQALDLAWDVERRRWYDLYPERNLAPDDGMHWSGPYKNFNARCAECHATGYEKHYRVKERRYNSRQAEMGVGCEACHGPGEAHGAWAAAVDDFDRSRWHGVGRQGFTLRFSKSDPELEIQQCATCHARREPFSDASPRPGTPFHDAYRLSTLRAGLYYPDGQMRDEVYVYGSFLQSPMYARGVRCTNCHDPHSGALLHEGNALCTQCHGQESRAEFPSLVNKRYDTTAHHFHPEGSPGARCVACHMPERVYMGIDGRRDHSFRVPRPDLSARLETPNVCAECHPERTARWAAATIAEHHPEGRQTQPHWGEIIARARKSLDTTEVRALLSLAGDRGAPAIVRASALDHLQPAASPAQREALLPLLADGEPLVRAEAAGLFSAAPPETRARHLHSLLRDPRRNVRLAVVSLLLTPAASEALPAEDRPAFDSAVRELQRSLASRADFPGGQLQLAGTAMQFADARAAEAAFREALRMDPQLEPAWIGLARLHSILGQLDRARAVLTEAIAAIPDSATLHVLRAETELAAGEPGKALLALEQANRLDPNYPGLDQLRERARRLAASH